MNRMTNTVALILLGVGTAGLSVGCHSNASYSNKDDAMSVQVQPSAHKALVGETVTFLSRTENTLGRDAKLEWKTTGGDLSTEQDGRIARVKFDQQGTFTVSAILSADGKVVDRSDTDIQVSPLP
jgi:hypothetical protein